MPKSRANPGFGVEFRIGDGGVGSAAKAFKTIGTTNQQTRYDARTAGVAGNSITIAHLGGLNQTLSVSVVGLAITVQLATDGSSVVTSTVSDVVDAVNSHAAASLLVLATNGVGNGSGLAIAAAVSNLASGTAGTELFPAMAEITDVPGLGATHRTDEVTHMGSIEGWAEHIALGVKEQKSFTLALNFVADDADQKKLFQDRIASGVEGNYQIKFTDDLGTLLTFAAIITDTDISHSRDSKADLAISVLPTGKPVWTVS